ncbi:Uncharacterised protein [Streptococcus pyogenes]|nr:Uncharacterised protein [Streptococcus pyogenes]
MLSKLLYFDTLTSVIVSYLNVLIFSKSYSSKDECIGIFSLIEFKTKVFKFCDSWSVIKFIFCWYVFIRFASSLEIDTLVVLSDCVIAYVTGEVMTLKSNVVKKINEVINFFVFIRNPPFVSHESETERNNLLSNLSFLGNIVSV